MNTGNEPMLVPHTPFSDLSERIPAGHRVTVANRERLAFAAVMARKGKAAELAQRVRERFQLKLPQGPYRTIAGNLAFAGIGSEAWLVTTEGAASTVAASLRATIGDLASVSDQSDAYAALRIAGPKARDVLNKLLPIDVHPNAFQVGDVAVSAAGHILTTLWRLEDDQEESPVFELAVPGSVGDSFLCALEAAASEFFSP